MSRFLLGCTLALAVTSPAAGQRSIGPVTDRAREAIADFGRCVAKRSPEKAHRVLTIDFRSLEYRQALRTLGQINRDCHRSRLTMRTGGLPLAGAMAEALLTASREPLNVRLLRAAPTEAPTYAPSDQVAMCVARSDPDNSAALLTARIASDAENKAAAALGTAIRRCTPQGVRMDVKPFALRSILATASYRLLAHAAQRSKGSAR